VEHDITALRAMALRNHTDCFLLQLYYQTLAAAHNAVVPFILLGFHYASAVVSSSCQGKNHAS